MHPYICEYQMPNDKECFINQVNQECYDHCASTWDRFPFPHILPTMVKKHYHFPLSKKVLDVGSGTGILAKWLADEGFDVFCIDPSAEMVRRCKAKGLNIQQRTLQEYEPPIKFGMIFAILSLIHVPKEEFEDQIKKLANALEPQGLLFLGMLEGKGEGFFEGPPYPRFFAYYSENEIRQNVGPYFEVIDYNYVKNGIGYMLFVLRKKNPIPT